jgi:exosome complex RNA-binding protein Rrp42 (RNase PH superfamily)
MDTADLQYHIECPTLTHLNMALRPDGRNLDTLRELRISYEGLCRADGSASFAFGI